MDTISQEIRRLLLAGLGVAAEGKEKGEKLLEELAVKGEETLKQGKIINEELKRNIHKTLKNEKSTEEVLDSVKDMDPEQLEALKARIAELEAEKAAAAGTAEE